MKKLLFVLFLTFATATVFAQVQANDPTQTIYANGDSYGYTVQPVAGAIDYTWSVTGGASIFPAWDTAIDIIFPTAGYYTVTCTVTRDSLPPLTFDLDVYVANP